jgi:RNA polymerase sigma-70 factor, ECF subfamily
MSDTEKPQPGTARSAPAQRTGHHQRPLDDASREWLRCLAGADGDLRGAVEREQALARLHDVLLRAARAELRRRDPVYIDGPEREDLALQAADDALLAITGKLDQFRGESRFTTWAYKFVILEVSARLARHYWRNPPVHVSDDAWERIPDRFGAGPADRAESRDLVEALRRAVGETLSERQRRVFIAVVVEGVPLDALAVQLGSTCNAIYKTMFDARRKIRAHLVAHGYLAEEGQGA